MVTLTEENSLLCIVCLLYVKLADNLLQASEKWHKMLPCCLCTALDAHSRRIIRLTARHMKQIRAHSVTTTKAEATVYFFAGYVQ